MDSVNQYNEEVDLRSDQRAREQHVYVPAFDGLRCLCILMVIVDHVWTEVSAPDSWYHDVARRGWYGVDVFFVLSGFLITWILASEYDATGSISLRRFYWRRFLRLMPAYWIAISINLAVQSFLNPSYFSAMLLALPLFLTYTLNIAVAFGYPKPPLGLAWSLCLEEQFYFFWPWLLRWVGLARGLGIAAWSIAAIAVYRSGVYWWVNGGFGVATTQYTWFRVYHAPDTRMDVILIGCALALSIRTNWGQAIREQIAAQYWFSTAAVLVAAGAIWWGTGGEPSGGSLRSGTIGYTLMALATAGVVAAVFVQPRQWLARLLAWRPMVFVGRISYGIYLFHPLVRYVTYGFLQLHPGTPAPAVKLWLALPMVWFGTIAFAALHYRFIEEPFLSMRGQLSFRAHIPEVLSATVRGREERRESPLPVAVLEDGSQG